jgi:uncharacterized protein involved in response to NO
MRLGAARFWSAAKTPDGRLRAATTANALAQVLIITGVLLVQGRALRIFNLRRIERLG